ncbi:hypothetical protein BURC_04755 [Burkholderiaceae bacterium]|nr:hypothetical protein BURC_04755 [Burkholderiaceae bacterium]
MAQALVHISKVGCCGGRPSATVLVDPKAKIDDITTAIQKNVTRNRDLLKKLGLKACSACISGFDIDIRQRYDIDMNVQIGG